MIANVLIHSFHTRDFKISHTAGLVGDIRIKVFMCESGDIRFVETHQRTLVFLCLMKTGTIPFCLFSYSQCLTAWKLVHWVPLCLPVWQTYPSHLVFIQQLPFPQCPRNRLHIDWIQKHETYLSFSQLELNKYFLIIRLFFPMHGPLSTISDKQLLQSCLNTSIEEFIIS